MRVVTIAAVTLAAAVLSACGTARDVEQSEAATGCANCHESAPTSGAHQAHLVAGTYSNPLACASCHVVPQSHDHFDGNVDVELSAMARQGVSSPGYAGEGGSCATYCHGSTSLLGGNTSPAWISTAGLACNGCHSLEPTSGLHEFHRNPPSPFAPVACAKCHPGYSTAPAEVNLDTHLNGTFEASPINTTATFSSWPGGCIACHSDGIPVP